VGGFISVFSKEERKMWKAEMVAESLKNDQMVVMRPSSSSSSSGTPKE
jgi:hypothetical protein